MSESLRDTITSAVDEKLDTGSNPDDPAPQVEAPAEPPKGADNTPADSSEQKGSGRTAGRARDEKGRLLPGPADPAAKAEPAPKAAPLAVPAAPAAPLPPKVQRPSTWKKEHWESFDKLAAENPALAAYINQREGEYANGVSTYKREWDSAKPLIDAMAPFMPILQQHGIQPAQWIQNLGNAHRMLAMGSPQEKAQRFAQLAREYGVPLDQVFVQGPDGKLYVNQNLQAAPQQQQAQSQIRPEDIDARIEQRLLDRQSALEISAMERDSEKYPHFSEVRETMAGLLQAGLADGLDDAYQAALRHPRHAQLFEAIQEQNRQADEHRQAEEKRKAAEAARRKTASVRSATPTSPGASATGKEALRTTIAAAFDAKVGGRV